MKKNDENQNSDSGLTRRIYKKANLDDTVVNIKKDSSDDFNLLSGDEMMDYVPGVDDVDHFDFDESDIEHYRKLNEQEAAERDRRRKQRAAEKQRAAQNQQRTEKSDEQPQEKRQNKQAGKAAAKEVPVKKTNTKKQKRRGRKKDDLDIDDTELRRELSEKKRTNKEIMRITYVMMILFFGMEQMI